MKIHNIILLAVTFCVVLGGSIFLITKSKSSSESKTEQPAVTEKIVSKPKQLKLAPAKSVSVPDQPKAAQNTNSSPTPFFIALLLVLGVSQIASIFLIRHLFRMRQYTSNAQVSIVPEELLKALTEQSGALGQNTKYISEYIKRIIADREKTDGDIVELQKSFALFQDSLNKKDEEIERLKKGYDTAVYEKFLNKFIKFYVELKKEADAPENQANAPLLNDMLDLLGDALVECNLQVKAPEIMGSAEDYASILNAKSKTLETDNPELDGKVAQVIMPAFILGNDVLREAIIVIYSYRERKTA